MKIGIDEIKTKIELLESMEISDGERYKELLMFINCDYIWDNIKSKMNKIIRDNQVKTSPADMLVMFNVLEDMDRLEKYSVMSKLYKLEQKVVSSLVRLQAELSGATYNRKTQKYIKG